MSFSLLLSRYVGSKTELLGLCSKRDYIIPAEAAATPNIGQNHHLLCLRNTETYYMLIGGTVTDHADDRIGTTFEPDSFRSQCFAQSSINRRRFSNRSPRR